MPNREQFEYSNLTKQTVPYLTHATPLNDQHYQSFAETHVVHYLLHVFFPLVDG